MLQFQDIFLLLAVKLQLLLPWQPNVGMQTPQWNVEREKG